MTQALAEVLPSDALADAPASAAAVHVHHSQCLNCGAAVEAHFCAHCGQETAAHVPSAREFLHEFVGHYVALEGKLWKTLALLLFRPGRLTRDYIEGKRARYVLPLRVYLTMSLVFFAVVKLNTHGHEGTDEPKKAQAEQKADQATRLKDLQQTQAELEALKKQVGPISAAGVAAGQLAVEAAKREELARAAKGAEPARKRGASITSVDKDTGRKLTLLSMDEADNTWLNNFPKVRAKIDKFTAMDAEEQKHMFFSWLPYAVFAMMPVFAMYLKLMYLGSGRVYGEHLLFALHTNAFAFLAFTLLMLVPAWMPFVKPALGIWLALYLPTAMRKVYGGSRKATFVRWVALMALHGIGLVLALAVAGAAAVLA
jgi:hypothetical protein